MAESKDTDRQFRFRVSDALEIPLRGWLLRLRLVEGLPEMEDVMAGRQLRLSSPDGEERLVRIADHSATGGRPTKKRIREKRELDIIVSREDANRDGRRIDIGWMAIGPARSGA